MAFLKKLLRWWRRRVKKPRRRRARVRPSRRRKKVVRKSSRRKTTRRLPVRRLQRRAKPSSKIKASEAGVVTHYFGKVKAAVVKLKAPLKLGDPIWVKGTVTDFRQTVGSLQIDRKVIEKAAARAEVGLEVMKEVRPGDKVYVLEDLNR